MEPIFRSRSISVSQNQLFGEVVLSRSPRFISFTLFIVCCVSILLVSSFFVGFARQDRVRGWLVSNYPATEVRVQQVGVVTARHVMDGQSVSVGDPLFTITPQMPSLQLVIQELQKRKYYLQTEIKAHQKELLITLDTLKKKKKELQQRIALLSDEIDFQRQRIEITGTLADKLSSLHVTGVGSYESVSIAKQDYLKAMGHSKALERDRAELQTQVTLVQGELDVSPVKASIKIAQLQQKLADTEQQIIGAEENVINADRAGVMTALMGKVGQAVDSGDVLATISPHVQDITAELYIPDTLIGHVKPGLRVTLRYSAYPYLQYGSQSAIIKRIDTTPVPAAAVKQEWVSFSPSNSYYRGYAEVESDHLQVNRRLYPLNAGMRLECHMKLEYRTIFDWIYHSFRSSVS